MNKIVISKSALPYTSRTNQWRILALKATYDADDNIAGTHVNEAALGVVPDAHHHVNTAAGIASK